MWEPKESWPSERALSGEGQTVAAAVAAAATATWTVRSSLRFRNRTRSTIMADRDTAPCIFLLPSALPEHTCHNFMHFRGTYNLSHYRGVNS